MKSILLTLLFAIISSTIFAQNLSETDRIRIAESFNLGNKLSEKIWKDWSKAPFGVLLITPETEFLINHPNPSNEFAEISFDKALNSKVLWRKRVFDQGLLATFPAVNGVSTIVVGQAENTASKTSTPWTVTLLHEHFHQFQTTQPNYYEEVNALNLANGDTSGMWMLNYAFPYSDEKVKGKFEELCKALATLIERPDKKIAKEKLAEYLIIRKDFQNLLKLNDYRYFSFQIWQEGVARYTEYQIAKSASKNYQPNAEFSTLKDFSSYQTVAENLFKKIIDDLKTLGLDKYKRTAFYPFGAGEALLLDKVNPKWKTLYHSERFYLEKYFEKKN